MPGYDKVPTYPTPEQRHTLTHIPPDRSDREIAHYCRPLFEKASMRTYRSRCLELWSHSHLLIAGILLLSSLWVLAGCSPQTSSFVFTHVTELDSITWQEDYGDINGSWVSNEYAGGGSYTYNLNDVTVASSQTLSGNEQNNQIHLKKFFDLSNTTLTGTIQNTTLFLAIPDDRGHLVATTWYAATPAQYHQLLSAFQEYMLVKAAQDSFDHDIQWQTALLASAESDVSQEQTDIQQFRGDLNVLTSCDKYDIVALDARVANNDFTLFEKDAHAPDVSELNQDIQRADADWHQASKAPLPHIQGLLLPWVISTSPINTEKDTANHLITRYQKDQQTMAALQQQDQSLNNQLQLFKRTHSCS